MSGEDCPKCGHHKECCICADLKGQKEQYQYDEQERLEQEEQFYINNPHEGDN